MVLHRSAMALLCAAFAASAAPAASPSTSLPAGKLLAHAPATADQQPCRAHALFVPAGKINTYAPPTQRCVTTDLASDADDRASRDRVGRAR